MQHAPRHFLRSGVDRREAEHVGVQNRLGAEPGAEAVADDSADAGRRAAVRLQRRRVIVRLDLEADAVLLIELDHAGVVVEHRQAPRQVQLLGSA